MGGDAREQARIRHRALRDARLDERLDVAQAELIHEYVATKIYRFETR